MTIRFLRLAAGIVCTSVLMLAGTTAVRAAAVSDILRTGLESARVADTVEELTPLASGSADARMALGFARFALAVEHLTQGLYRYGFKTPQNPFIPVLRLPVPYNPAAEPVNYETLRAVYARFLDDLTEARTALLQTEGAEGKLILDLYAVRLNATPKSNPPVLLSLKDVLAALQGQRVALRPAAGQSPATAAETWEVAFDRADALWLAGYTHMLSGMMEFILAHDWHETFNATAPLFFPRAKPALSASGTGSAAGNAWTLPEMDGIADQIALLHLIHWPAGDRARMHAALEHFKAAVALSRETWKAVLTETDDDREWLPSPRQQSRALASMPITEETLKSWHQVLDELDAIFDGRKLVGHWRSTKGIDLRAVFEDPQPFDLVLWITGHGVQPFLKDGAMADAAWWRQWNATFGNNFLGYLFYVN